MASTSIQFQKVSDNYVCQLSDYQTTKRGGVIHLALSEPNQIVVVSAGADGMPPMVVQTLSTPPYGLGLVFELDFPDGIDVTLSTTKPVTQGVWIN